MYGRKFRLYVKGLRNDPMRVVSYVGYGFREILIPILRYPILFEHIERGGFYSSVTLE